jgi:cytochrome oxidase Cu insertion factor (SCO1/SenC/PrrC family)
MRTYFLLLLTFPLFASPEIPLPDESKTHGRALPRVTLTAEDGTPLQLSDLRGKPLILNPVFVSCPHTCSPITHSLRTAADVLREKGYVFQILTFSFDPNDSVASLHSFREKLGLPKEWHLAWAPAEAIDRILKAIDFQTRPLDDGGFAHPNLVAVFNADLKLEKYVFGVELSVDELELALIEASRTAPWWNRLEKGLLVFCLVGCAVAAFVFYFRKRAPKATL